MARILRLVHLGNGEDESKARAGLWVALGSDALADGGLAWTNFLLAAAPACGARLTREAVVVI
jgi:Family of unknown function (DUF6112)